MWLWETCQEFPPPSARSCGPTFPPRGRHVQPWAAMRVETYETDSLDLCWSSQTRYENGSQADRRVERSLSRTLARCPQAKAPRLKACCSRRKLGVRQRKQPQSPGERNKVSSRFRPLSSQLAAHSPTEAAQPGPPGCKHELGKLREAQILGHGDVSDRFRCESWTSVGVTQAPQSHFLRSHCNHC